MNKEVVMVVPELCKCTICGMNHFKKKKTTTYSEKQSVVKKKGISYSREWCVCPVCGKGHFKKKVK